MIIVVFADLQHGGLDDTLWSIEKKSVENSLQLHTLKQKTKKKCGKFTSIAHIKTKDKSHFSVSQSFE
jgi:hypothetical protein